MCKHTADYTSEGSCHSLLTRVSLDVIGPRHFPRKIFLISYMNVTIVAGVYDTQKPTPKAVWKTTHS